MNLLLEMRLLLIVFALVLLDSYCDASTPCTYNGVQYPCGQVGPNGKICNNLMMQGGNYCLITWCTTYESCSCHPTDWNCQLGLDSNITLHHNGTFTITSNTLFI